jgi:hypothetical protein
MGDQKFNELTRTIVQWFIDAGMTPEEAESFAAGDIY